jgi:hypothetical protein
VVTNKEATLLPSIVHPYLIFLGNSINHPKFFTFRLPLGSSEGRSVIHIDLGPQNVFFLTFKASKNGQNYKHVNVKYNALFWVSGYKVPDHSKKSTQNMVAM